MNSGWKECKLGDVADFKNGKSRPRITENGNSPIYGGNGILGYTDKYNGTGETVIIGRVGAYCGSVYYENKPIWVSDNALYAVPKSDTSVKFLYYLLKKMDLNNQAEGSSHPLLTQTLLNSLDILITDSHVEQRAIAGVLSSLDDKIDLLHRQNKTLEAMAEALWRKMFIEDADPNWTKGRLGDLIKLCYGKGLKEENREPGGYPVLGSNGIVGFHNEFLVEGPGIVIGRKGTLGVVHYIEDNFFPIDTTFYIKSNTNKGKLFFEYFLLKEFVFEDMNSDSAVPGLNREIAESLEQMIPDVEAIYKFNEFCEPLFVKINKNKKQVRKLSHMRDTLLPKLMSGEVRVML